MSLKVAFQGEPGAHSQVAASVFFPSSQTIAHETFEKAIEAVANGTADRAVFPFENSYVGQIPGIIEVILQSKKVHIVDEFIYRDQHFLVGPENLDIKEIKEVISHPQVLDQCHKNLEKLGLTHSKWRATYDTAGSALLIEKSKLKDAAAICSKEAAQRHGLKSLLEQPIQDDQNATTRYIVVAKEDIKPQQTGRPFKTTIVFSIKNVAGALFKALSCFALRNISISRIEGRPSSRCGKLNITIRPWEYVNYIDIEGNINEEHVRNAINNLKEYATLVTLLGSYPVATDLVIGEGSAVIHGCT